MFEDSPDKKMITWVRDPWNKENKEIREVFEAHTARYITLNS